MNKYLEKVAEIHYTYELNQPNLHPDFISQAKLQAGNLYRDYRLGHISEQELLDGLKEIGVHYEDNHWLKRNIFAPTTGTKINEANTHYHGDYAKAYSDASGAPVAGALLGGGLGTVAGLSGGNLTAGLAGAAVGGILGLGLGQLTRRSSASHEATNKFLNRIMREE